MSTAASRSVLDWFRTWAVDRLDVIGRTDAAMPDPDLNVKRLMKTTIRVVNWAELAHVVGGG